MIPLCIPEIRGNEWEYIKECLNTNWVSSVGSYVNLFEENFAKYVGAEKAVVTMNGTAAIHLALVTLGIGSGDEVIVPSMTFISPVNAIKYVGAKPVFVDITEDTWVMDPNKIEELITPKTKAILPVHIYGNIADMDKILEIAKKHNLYVIEDATESLASHYKTNDGIWHMAGTLGHIGCYSFNGNKLITTGAGGMLVTDDVELAKRAKHLATQTKNVGENGIFYHDEVGYNFRMPNILAAMGVAQLEKAEEYASIKIANARLYDSNLKNTKCIKFVAEKENIKNVHWLYSVLIGKDYPISRDELVIKLRENGIDSRGFFYPVHLMPPYKDCKCGSMENTLRISNEGINLPSSVGIKEDQIKVICDLLK